MDVHWDPVLFEEESIAMSSTAVSRGWHPVTPLARVVILTMESVFILR